MSAATRRGGRQLGALLAERTGDRGVRAQAVRSLGYATYFSDSRGRVSCCGRGSQHQYWFSDGYGDYLGSLSLALATLPQLAPRDENHVLGSSSVVQRVTYGGGWVAYRTFSPHAVESLRLRFKPARVVANGQPLPHRAVLVADGYTVTRYAGGFFVCVRHDHAHRIVVTARATA